MDKRGADACHTKAKAFKIASSISNHTSSWSKRNPLGENYFKNF